MKEFREIKGIILDKDGTLTDLAKVWNPYYSKVLVDISYISKVSLQNIALDCGFDIKHQSSQKNSILWSGTPEEIINQWSLSSKLEKDIIQKIASKHYKSVEHDYPIINDLSVFISKLANKYNLAIASLDTKEMIENSMEALSISKYIDQIYASDSIISKPSTEVVYSFMNYASLSASEIAVVGDSETDMQMAKESGSLAIGVLSGSCNYNQLKVAGADVVIVDISFLANL